MRILVFSDSHKDSSSCIKVTDNLIGVDMILHAGDHASDAQAIGQAFPNIPVRFVQGNCDCGDYPSDIIIEADGKKIFLTHGHKYSVKFEYDYRTLLSKAASENCDCVVFGHTHSPICDIKNNITLLNPGSIRYGRTYGVIEIENGVLKAAVCNM